MSRKLVGVINRYQADPSGWFGSAVMFLFAIIAMYRWQVSGLIFFLLFAFRDVAASWFLLTRNELMSQSKEKWIALLAYISTGFPFLYLNSSSEIIKNAGMIASLLTIIGFGLATIALFDLGTSFGVTAANRGRVSTGVYRFIKHPMYLGYIISELGFILLNPLNIFLWISSTLLYIWRARIENKHLL